MERDVSHVTSSSLSVSSSLMPSKAKGPRVNKLSSKYLQDKLKGRTQRALDKVAEEGVRGHNQPRKNSPDPDPPVIVLSSDSDHDDDDDGTAQHPAVEESRIISGNVLAGHSEFRASFLSQDSEVNGQRGQRGHAGPRDVGGGPSNCAAHLRFESTHADHLDFHPEITHDESTLHTLDHGPAQGVRDHQPCEAPSSVFTEDATEYYSALGDSDHGRESSSEDTFVTSPAVARAEPTNLARRDVEQGEVTPPAEPSGSKMTANVLFSVGKRKSLVPKAFNARPTLADDSEEEADDIFPPLFPARSRGGGKAKANPKRRSVLGRNEVVLLTSDSDSDFEPINVRIASPEEKVEDWVRTSPFEREQGRRKRLSDYKQDSYSDESPPLAGLGSEATSKRLSMTLDVESCPQRSKAKDSNLQVSMDEETKDSSYSFGDSVSRVNGMPVTELSAKSKRSKSCQRTVCESTEEGSVGSHHDKDHSAEQGTRESTMKSTKSLQTSFTDEDTGSEIIEPETRSRDRSKEPLAEEAPETSDLSDEDENESFVVSDEESENKSESDDGRGSTRESESMDLHLTVTTDADQTRSQIHAETTKKPSDDSDSDSESNFQQYLAKLKSDQARMKEETDRKISRLTEAMDSFIVDDDVIEESESENEDESDSRHESSASASSTQELTPLSLPREKKTRPYFESPLIPSTSRDDDSNSDSARLSDSCSIRRRRASARITPEEDSASEDAESPLNFRTPGAKARKKTGVILSSSSDSEDDSRRNRYDDEENCVDELPTPEEISRRPRPKLFSEDAGRKLFAPIENTPFRKREKPTTTKRLYDDEGENKPPKPLVAKPEVALRLKAPKPARSRPKNAVEKTFLQSLSLVTPDETCHPEAVKYLTHYPKHKAELAKRLFKLFNEECFVSSLDPETAITWNVRLTKTAGLCAQKSKLSNGQITRSSAIELSSKVLDSADRLRDTLIHEMCHAASWVISGYRDGHGPLWKHWAQECMARFPELPLIARCHSYAIRTKYTYKCEKCGYQIGRHSKSLDTERKVCGKCRGNFVLFVNKMGGAASATPGRRLQQATPKNPNKFALFVKENYKIVRTPGVKHDEAMKLLSQKFSRTKLE